MADLSNMTGLEKPLVKLIETVGDGLGVAGNTLFKLDAKKIKRISEAEAEAEKNKIIKKAEGEAEALAILSRASQRFELEQFSKQINLESVMVKSQEILKDTQVSNQPVDKDWSRRFVGVAQDISNEEVQNILARILANEVASPSQYSLRTLELIKNLGQNDLKIFQKFVALSSKGVGLFVANAGSNEELDRYGLSFSEFLHLADIDLFNSSSTLSLKIALKPGEVHYIDLASNLFSLESASENEVKLQLQLLKFTEMGIQIASALPQLRVAKKYIEAYENGLTKNIASKGVTIKKAVVS